VTGVAQRAKRQKDGETMEVDVLVTNGDDVVLIEAKSTLSVGDVKDHLQRLRTFPHFFPEYATHHVFGAVAGCLTVE
jgi:hypothetical protein